MVDCGQWAHTRSTDKQGAERVNGSQDRQGLASKASPLKPTSSTSGFADPLPLMGTAHCERSSLGTEQRSSSHELLAGTLSAFQMEVTKHTALQKSPVSFFNYNHH